MKTAPQKDMKITSGTYVFKYEGDIEYISLDTLLASQFHFSQALSEIKSELYPDQQLDIKVKALPKGSFQIEILINMGYIQHLLSPDVVTYASGVIGALGGIISIIEWLKGSKPEKAVDAGDNVILTKGDGNTTTVNKNVYNIYTSNPKIEREIIETIRPIEEDMDITGVKLYDTETGVPLIDIAREDFPLYTVPNEIFNGNRSTKFQANAHLVVYKVVFDKGPKWQFIHEGHKVTASMNDKDFIKKLDNERFGKGDVLVADIEIEREYDESLATHRVKQYRVIKVKEHRARDAEGRQSDLFDNSSQNS